MCVNFGKQFKVNFLVVVKVKIDDNLRDKSHICCFKLLVLDEDQSP